MVGLIGVKKELITQYHQITLATEQGDRGASSYNARFEGNPGTGTPTLAHDYRVLSGHFANIVPRLSVATGKTTVARHYSTFLQQLGVLPEGAVSVEVTAATLIHQGVKHLEELLEKVKEAEGGVIFIDEVFVTRTDSNYCNVPRNYLTCEIVPTRHTSSARTNRGSVCSI